MTELLAFWSTHRDEAWALVRQHLMLVSVSTIVATTIGVPVAVLASRRPRLGRVLMGAANVAQTIPSLALLGFLLPLPFIGGIGPRTALVTLTVYALLPVMRSTLAGLRSIDAAVVEAGTALGMTGRQLLWMVELPLALPSIVGGVRVAAVIGVGTAAIAAAIGAGGLGEYIFRGLAMVDATTILAGALPAALLAVLIDAGLAWTERALQQRRRRALLGAGALVAAGLAILLWPASVPGTAAVVVGSKNFTEQVVLGELVAQAIEAEGLTVARKLNLGGTFICDQALRSGGLDLYVEYTGTAVTAIFDRTVRGSSTDTLALTRSLYEPLGLTVAGPLGFNNTFAMLVRSSDARASGLRSIADLRQVTDRFTPGFGHEFLQRADGYAGITAHYGLAFAQPPRSMELSLIYSALANGQVDVIAGDATSALIDALDLTMLEDTLAYFPPYDAVPVVRQATLEKHPEVGRALGRLSGQVTAEAMRAMNKAVDVDHRSPRSVAAEFLATVRRTR